jgi:hypothetical protein
MEEDQDQQKQHCRSKGEGKNREGKVWGIEIDVFFLELLFYV